MFSVQDAQPIPAFPALKSPVPNNLWHEYLVNEVLDGDIPAVDAVELILKTRP